MHRLGTAGQTGSIKFVTRITHPDHITNNSRHKSHNSESPGMPPTFIFLAKACCALHVYCVLRTRDSYLDNITTFRCYSSTHLSHTAKYNCHRANQISNIYFLPLKKKKRGTVYYCNNQNAISRHTRLGPDYGPYDLRIMDHSESEHHKNDEP